MAISDCVALGPSGRTVCDLYGDIEREEAAAADSFCEAAERCGTTASASSSYLAQRGVKQQQQLQQFNNGERRQQVDQSKGDIGGGAYMPLGKAFEEPEDYYGEQHMMTVVDAEGLQTRGEFQQQQQQHFDIGDEQQQFIVDGTTQWDVENVERFITESEETNDFAYSSFGSATAATAKAPDSRAEFLFEFFPTEKTFSAPEVGEESLSSVAAGPGPQTQRSKPQREEERHFSMRQHQSQSQQGLICEASEGLLDSDNSSTAEIYLPRKQVDRRSDRAAAIAERRSKSTAAGEHQQAVAVTSLHAVAEGPNAVGGGVGSGGTATAKTRSAGQHGGSMSMWQQGRRQRDSLSRQHERQQQQEQSLIRLDTRQTYAAAAANIEEKDMCYDGATTTTTVDSPQITREETGEAEATKTPLLTPSGDLQITRGHLLSCLSTAASSLGPQQQQQQHGSSRSVSPSTTSGLTPLLSMRSPVGSASGDISANATLSRGLSFNFSSSHVPSPAAGAAAASNADCRPGASSVAVVLSTSACPSVAAAAASRGSERSSSFSPPPSSCSSSSSAAAAVCAWLRLPVHLFKSPQELLRMLANRVYYSRVMAAVYAGVFVLNFYVLYRCLTLAQLDCFTLAAEVCVTLTLLFEVLLRALLAGWKFFSKYENLFDVGISLLCVALLFTSDMRVTPPAPLQGGKTGYTGTAASLLQHQRAPPEDASDILRESLTAFRFATQLLRMISLGLHHSRAKLPADDVDFSYLQERTCIHDDGL